jgi:hypothetical protein
MHINMQWVWAGIIGWSALSLLAMVFVHGGNRNRFKGE